MGGPRRWSLHPDTSTNEHWLRPATEASAPDTVRPLAPSRYHLHVTMDAEAHAALRKLQDLLHPEVPNGDPALIVGRALTLLLRHVERRKFAAKAAGGAAGRNVTPLSANAEREASPDASPHDRHSQPAIGRGISRTLCADNWRALHPRPRFEGPCGNATKAGAPSLVRAGVVRSAAGSSFTTESRWAEVVQRRSTTLPSSAAPITSGRRTSTTAKAQMEALRDRSSRLHGAIDAHGRGQARGLLEHRLSGGDRTRSARQPGSTPDRELGPDRAGGSGRGHRRENGPARCRRPTLKGWC